MNGHSHLSEKELRRQLRRQAPAGILEALAQGGRIKLETLQKFAELYPKKAKFNFHFELVVESRALFKTVDNEADLQEILKRLEAAPDRPDARGPQQEEQDADRRSR